MQKVILSYDKILDILQSRYGVQFLDILMANNRNGITYQIMSYLSKEKESFNPTEQKLLEAQILTKFIIEKYKQGILKIPEALLYIIGEQYQIR